MKINKIKIYGLIALIGSILYKVWKSGYNYAFNKQKKKNDKINKKIKKATSNLSARKRNRLRKQHNRRN